MDQETFEAVAKWLGEERALDLVDLEGRITALENSRRFDRTDTLYRPREAHGKDFGDWYNRFRKGD